MTHPTALSVYYAEPEPELAPHDQPAVDWQQRLPYGAWVGIRKEHFDWLRRHPEMCITVRELTVKATYEARP